MWAPWADAGGTNGYRTRAWKTELVALAADHRAAGQDGIEFHPDNIGPSLRRLLDLTGTYEHLHASRRPAAAAGTRRL